MTGPGGPETLAGAHLSFLHNSHSSLKKQDTSKPSEPCFFYPSQDIKKQKKKKQGRCRPLSLSKQFRPNTSLPSSCLLTQIPWFVDQEISVPDDPELVRLDQTTQRGSR